MGYLRDMYGSSMGHLRDISIMMVLWQQKQPNRKPVNNQMKAARNANKHAELGDRHVKINPQKHGLWCTEQGFIKIWISVCELHC